MANRKVIRSKKGPKLPPGLPEESILTDTLKRMWKTGKSIGSGGFGLIYIASDDVRNPISNNARYVVKVEPHSNGPLFTELYFYTKAAKEEKIKTWMKSKKLTYLGMPKFIANGSHTYQDIKYRFLVMERFGEDLQKLLDKNSGTFPLKTVYILGLKILDVLEYIHDQGYVHADIKASNLMTSFDKNKENEVYLVDFGLASQHLNKEDKDNKKKAHNGTLEFTSRDAHRGATSRRGDLEILAYNLLSWLCGRLPWDKNLNDPVHVHKEKNRYMEDIPMLLKECFSSNSPKGLKEFFTYVTNLKFSEKPNYDQCRAILKEGLRNKGYEDDGDIFVFKSPEKDNPPDFYNFTPPKDTRRIPRKALAGPKHYYEGSSESEISDSSCDSKRNCKISKRPRKPSKTLRSKKPQLFNISTTDSETSQTFCKSTSSQPFENPTPQMLEVQNKYEKKASTPKRRTRVDNRKDSSSFKNESLETNKPKSKFSDNRKDSSSFKKESLGTNKPESKFSVDSGLSYYSSYSKSSESGSSSKFDSNPTAAMLEVQSTSEKKSLISSKKSRIKTLAKDNNSPAKLSKNCNSPSSSKHKANDSSSSQVLSLKIPKQCKVKEFSLVLENNPNWDSSDSG